MASYYFYNATVYIQGNPTSHVPRPFAAPAAPVAPEDQQAPVDGVRPLTAEAYRQDLLRRIQTLHHFRCDIHEKTFSTRGSFKRHLITSCTGQRALRCGYCDYVAYRRDNMSTHVRAKHPEAFPGL